MKIVSQSCYMVLVAILLALFCCTVISAQNKKPTVGKRPATTPAKPVETIKPPERPISVTLKEGEPVSGRFLNATSEGIQMAVAGNTLIVKWGDIAKVVFTDVVVELPTPKVTAETKSADAVANALKALRKLSSATEVGINFRDYGSRVVDVKTELNELLPTITEGRTKEAIQSAMSAYQDAGTLWNGYIQSTYFSTSSEATLLLKKYSLSYEANGTCIFESGCILPKVWAIAKTRLDEATRFASEK